MMCVKVESEEGDYFINYVIEKWCILDIGIIGVGVEKYILFEV